MQQQSFSEHLLQLFQETIIGSTESIAQAEVALALYSEKQQFLSVLFQIAKERSFPYNVRKAAILYTFHLNKNMANNKRKQQSEKQQEKVYKYCMEMFDQLAQSDMEIKLRGFLIVSIGKLAQFDKNGSVKCAIYQKCLNHIERCLAESTFDNLCCLGLALQTAMMISTHTTKQLTDFIKNSLLPFIKIIQNIFPTLLLQIQQQNRQATLQTFSVLKTNTYALKQLFKKICYCDSQTINFLLCHQVSLLLSKSWAFTLPANQLQTLIIYYSRNPDVEMVEQFHSIKYDLIQCLYLQLRTVFQSYKNSKVLEEHLLISSPQLVPFLVKSLCDIGREVHFCQIRSPSLIKLIEELMNCLTLLVRTNHYYQIFSKLQQQIIEQCIFKILTVDTKKSYDLFDDDPQEWINQILQVIDMDPTSFIQKAKNDVEIAEQIQDIEDHTTLKTVAATFLSQYCKIIDGTLAKIMLHLQNIINDNKNKIVNPNKQNYSVFLIVFGILRDQVCTRQVSANSFVEMMVNQLKDLTIFQQKSQQIQLALTMLILQKYLLKLKNLSIPLYSLHQIVTRMITTSNLPQCLKILAYDLITIIITRSSAQEHYSLQYIVLLNKSLTQEYGNNTCRQLQVMYNIYKYKDEEIQQQAVLQTLRGLEELLKKQIGKGWESDGNVVSKCWNVVNDICANSWWEGVRGTIQQMLIGLYTLVNCQGEDVDCIRQKQNNQYILVCLKIVLECSQNVSQNVEQLVSNILAYILQNKKKQFEIYFEDVMIFLSKMQSKWCQQLLHILQIAVSPIDNVSQSKQWKFQQIKKAIVLQNALILHGKCFIQQTLPTIVQQIFKKIQILSNQSDKNSQSQILIANLIAILAIILAMPLSQQIISQFDKLQILTFIIQNMQIIYIENVSKIITVSLSEVILKINDNFVLQNIQKILTAAVNLTQLMKINRFHSDNANKQYQSLLQMQCIENPLTKMNAISYLKGNILKLRDGYKYIWEYAVKGMREKDLKELRELIGTIVVNNQVRAVFKIKR